MTTATTRRAAPTKQQLKKRAELCQEAVVIERRIAPDNARLKAIGIELKAMADAAGEPFQHEFADLGSVAVAPPKAAEFKGNVPQIVTEAWQALKVSDQKTHIKAGLVKMTEQWSSASYGRVTIKTF